MNTLLRISNFFSKTLAVWIVVFAYISYSYPAYFTHFLGWIPALLAIIMFGMGMTLTPSDFKVVLTQPKAVTIGVLAQFLIMPLTAYVIALTFNLPPELAAGLILLGSCPGGTVSNIMTFIARGNIALSVAMTSVATLLAPVLTPFMFWLLASQWLSIDPVPMFYSVVKIVLAPVAAGVVLRFLFKSAIEKATQALPLVSVVAIPMVLTGIVSNSRDNLATAGVAVLGVVVLHNLLGHLLGYLVARFTKLSLHDAKAITIEVGMQNSALGTTLATAYLGPLAAIPSAVASILHNISGPTLASFFAGLKDEEADKADARHAKEGHLELVVEQPNFVEPVKEALHQENHPQN